jgi:transcriptional regulator with XRE-family HTH domain
LCQESGAARAAPFLIKYLCKGNFMVKFSERLKELRQEKGLSIQALAKEVQISSSALCRWENCQADIRGSQLVILAKYFDVTIDYLMGLED